MNSEYFNWEFDVNTFKLIGSGLISDKFTAIIELVKNSYDANATEVRIDFTNTLSIDKGVITIADNGIGMSKKDIATKWMRIGTNSKRTDTHTPAPFNRVFLGEKGIGRFAIEKISDHIVMRSKQSDSNDIHQLTVDWSVYEKENNSTKPTLFTSIGNKYENIDKDEFLIQNGTKLYFTKLKDLWTDKDIIRLKRELAKLVSPLNKINKYGFKIFVKAQIDNVLFDISDYEEVINQSLSYASNVYTVSFDNNNQEELHFNDDTKKMDILHTEIRNFGPVKVHIFHFNSDDKRKFKIAYKAKELKIDGFKIYRDSILATPFVETASVDVGVDSYRDVLGIDKRRWSNFFGKISSHDFIGIIEITKKDNPKIKDLTNRQDFEDTDEYREFKDFIFEQIKQIEAKLQYEKELLKQNKLSQIGEAQDEVQGIREQLDSLIDRDPSLKENIEPMYSYLKNIDNALQISNKEINELNSTLEKKEEFYHSLMSLQEYAADLAHMVRNSLDKILSISRFFVKHLGDTKLFNKSKMLNNELVKLREDVNYMLTYAESGHKLKQFDLSELMLKVFEVYGDRLQEEGIKIELTKPDTFVVTHVETFIRDVFNNLISNSRRSLSKIESGNKLIKCTATKDDDEFTIIFSDTGIGIDDNIKEKIYDRYFSTTKDEGGSGIGLYVVKNNLKTLNGTIELIESEFGTIGCSFKITIPIKKVEANG